MRLKFPFPPADLRAESNVNSTGKYGSNGTAKITLTVKAIPNTRAESRSSEIEVNGSTYVEILQAGAPRKLGTPAITWNGTTVTKFPSDMGEGGGGPDSRRA